MKCYLGLTATLAALPILYYDGELNTHYADLIKDKTPMGIVKTLGDKHNLKALLKENTAAGGALGDTIRMLANIVSTLSGHLESFDLTLADLYYLFSYLNNWYETRAAEVNSEK